MHLSARADDRYQTGCGAVGVAYEHAALAAFLESGVLLIGWGWAHGSVSLELLWGPEA
jgi:hypothetical protein